MTKKQYSKPQVIKVGNAVKQTLIAGVSRREILFSGRRIIG